MGLSDVAISSSSFSADTATTETYTLSLHDALPISTDAGVQLAFCWSHARRKFYEVQVATKAPLAEEALRRIAALYAIEADIRGQSAEDRRLARQQRSRPIVAAMHAWLTEQLRRVSGRSGLAQAMRYALNHRA